MSRVGLVPIALPSGVDVSIDESKVLVKGPKGTLEYIFHRAVEIERDGDIVSVNLKQSYKNEKGILKRLPYHNMDYYPMDSAKQFGFVSKSSVNLCLFKRSSWHGFNCCKILYFCDSRCYE